MKRNFFDRFPRLRIRFRENRKRFNFQTFQRGFRAVTLVSPCSLESDTLESQLTIVLLSNGHSGLEKVERTFSRRLFVWNITVAWILFIYGFYSFKNKNIIIVVHVRIFCYVYYYYNILESTNSIRIQSICNVFSFRYGVFNEGAISV